MPMGGPPTNQHMSDFPYQPALNLGLATRGATEIIGCNHRTFQRGLITVNSLPSRGNSVAIQHAKISKSGVEKYGVTSRGLSL